VVSGYIPRKGDFVWLNFDPQSGREQKGRRTAIIVSNTLFNEKTGLAFACPTTTKDRKYPFHLRVPAGLPVHGVVMVDQVKSVDYSSRKVTFIVQAPKDLVDEILAILGAILYD
jgi:mRNA interferase MazF